MVGFHWDCHEMVSRHVLIFEALSESIHRDVQYKLKYVFRGYGLTKYAYGVSREL